MASIVIVRGTSNQETAFQLTNISAADGDFSVNVIFPDKGSYQVITRMTSQTHDFAALASFIVIVPALQSDFNLFGGNYMIWVGLMIASAVGVASFLILKNINTIHKN